jgi:hypothetical protein
LPRPRPRRTAAPAARFWKRPRNHLSAIRGIGHKVAREIRGVAEALRERLSISAAPPLLPGFPSLRLELDSEDAGIDQEVRDRLLDAGIANTADLASSPDERLRRLVGGEAVERLRERLREIAAAQPVPGSLAEWTEALLAPQKKSASAAESRVRVLLGLDTLPGGALDDARPGARSAQQSCPA